MKKTLLSFVFIFSLFAAYSQCQVDTAYQFEVVTINQDTFNLDEFWAENPDKMVALEFFFADSPLCRETSPMINNAYKRFGCNEHDVFFLSINVSDDFATTAHYRDTLNLDLPMVSGDQGGSDLDELYQIHAYPTLVLLQKDFYLPDPDTVYNDSDEIDTIYTYPYTNIAEKDLWPVYSNDSLVQTLLTFGLNEYECGENQNASSIIENEISGFDIYPNPANQFFYINTANAEGDFNLEIFDISGRALESQQIKLHKNAAASIDISNLHQGLYIIRLSNSKSFYSRKLRII